MPINTVYQLLAEDGSAALEAAHRLLTHAQSSGLLGSGVSANEATAASTTGLLDARTGDWAHDLVRSLGLPGPPLLRHGRTGHGARPAPADAWRHSQAQRRDSGHCHRRPRHRRRVRGHASSGRHHSRLSSGTWSLLGLELPRPVTTEAARTACLSNERGVFGTVRLLRNVMGLWLMQGCRAAWSTREPAPSYETLVELASAATGRSRSVRSRRPLTSLPGRHAGKIEVLMRAGGRPAPGRQGELRQVDLRLARLQVPAGPRTRSG